MQDYLMRSGPFPFVDTDDQWDPANKQWRMHLDAGTNEKLASGGGVTKDKGFGEFEDTY